MKVSFNCLDEWLEELRQDCEAPDGVRRDLVRVTYRKRTDGQLPLCSISVVAGYRNESGELVELVEHVGQVMPHSSKENDVVWQKAGDLVDRIKAKAAELLVTVRGGAFKED